METNSEINASLGYIKLFRSIQQWKWYHDLKVSRVFEDILLNANHIDKQWQGVTIPRGSLVTSVHSVAKRCHLSQRQTRTALTKLISTNELTIKTTNRFSIISASNYEIYQGETTNRTTSNLANKRQTEPQKTTTNKNIFNKNEEEIYTLYPLKIGKQKALTAIINALQIIDAETLKAKVIAFAKDTENWLPENKQYIPNPATWFNQGRWEDDLLAYQKYHKPSDTELEGLEF